MANTYENYLETPKSLTFDQMRELHQKLLKEIENDPVGQELYDELIGEATTYAEIRAKWLSLDRSQKMEQDSFRTACHNSVITHFNMMARYLKTQGKILSGEMHQDMKKTINIFEKRQVISVVILSSSIAFVRDNT